MNILYYFRKYETSMYLWQVYHIIDELAHHDIQVDIFNPLDYTSLEEANTEVVRHLKSTKYDLFMTDQSRKTLYPETVGIIKMMGLPCLLIHFDNLMDPKRHIGYAQLFDLTMLLNRDDGFDYKRYNCKCVTAPYAANPYYFSDMRRDNGKDGICFIGTPYGTRCVPINKILRNNIPFELYANEKNIKESYKIADNMSMRTKIGTTLKQLETAPGRKVLLSALKCKIQPVERLDKTNEKLHIHNAVGHQEMNELYSNYSLSISMPEARNTGVLKVPVDIVHLRNFEIPMCAGLQITRYMKELSDYFEEDKEILFYRTEEELVEKVRYYISPVHRDEVEAKKTAARRRAENEHTWFSRFTRVFDALSL